MRAFFHPFLPNGPSGDPLLWVDLFDEGEALLIDLGDARNLPARKLLRVNRVVVTHTHLDHFMGFDQLLRLVLRRDRELILTGPAGFLRNVSGKLDGYTWNLIGDYPVRLRIEEVEGGVVRTTVFSGAEHLQPRELPDRPFDGTIHDCDAYAVEAAVLDHGIPVLGVRLREKERLAINKDRLDRMNLATGPWLNALKSDVRRGRPVEDTVEVPGVDGSSRHFRHGDLVEELILREDGQRIAYLTDLCHTASNVEKAIALARDAHLLVCETMFLHEDEALARERNHLTARQAGEIAREAGVQALAAIHVSSRYEGRTEELLREAAEAFGGPMVRLPE